MEMEFNDSVFDKPEFLTYFDQYLETYRQRGIRHVTTFAAWLDRDYVDRFGEPAFLDEYGAGLIGH